MAQAHLVALSSPSHASRPCWSWWWHTGISKCFPQGPAALTQPFSLGRCRNYSTRAFSTGEDPYEPDRTSRVRRSAGPGSRDQRRSHFPQRSTARTARARRDEHAGCPRSWPSQRCTQCRDEGSRGSCGSLGGQDRERAGSGLGRDRRWARLHCDQLSRPLRHAHQEVRRDLHSDPGQRPIVPGTHRGDRRAG